MSCAHWDHTVQLFICCDPLSPNCNTELGRWITAFRRLGGQTVQSGIIIIIIVSGYESPGRSPLFCQRHRALADGCVSATPPAGRQQMHPDHEDAALGHAVDGLPQPEVQNWQPDRCEGWKVEL